MFASDNIIVFSWSFHHNLVNASFSSSSNGSNVQSNVIIALSLSSRSCRSRESAGRSYGMMLTMMIVVIMVIMMASGGTSSIEWKGVKETLSITRVFKFFGQGSGDQGQKEELKSPLKSNEIFKRSIGLPLQNCSCFDRIEPTGVWAIDTSTAQWRLCPRRTWTSLLNPSWRTLGATIVDFFIMAQQSRNKKDLITGTRHLSTQNILDMARQHRCHCHELWRVSNLKNRKWIMWCNDFLKPSN